MKTKLISILFGLATVTLAHSAEIKHALAVEAPEGWTVKYKGEGGLQFYTINGKKGDPALLMFSRWPARGDAAQIPDLVNSLAKAFVTQTEKDPNIVLENKEYEVEKIEGAEFSGCFVRFSLKGGIVQTMFMVGDDDGIWNGQFTGTGENWAEALELLKRLRKNG